MYRMMTPGPTAPAKEVMAARGLAYENPDESKEFVELYHELAKDIAKLLHTDNEVYIQGAEGILSLESACASLTEPGDRVLVIDNGIFGAGFADFVKMYGGEPVIYTDDYKREIDIDKLKEFLTKDHDFSYATIVHCDTPTGVLNDVEEISKILKGYGILTVVDSVSASFGEEINVDAGQIDILCGGSQKAISAPPGLSLVCVSEDAFNKMHARKTPISAFYANILIFEDYYYNKWFPYTMPISDIYGLRAAIDIIKTDTDRTKRHFEVAKYVRERLTGMGISLYLESGFSSTVTAFYAPEHIGVDGLYNRLLDEYGIELGHSLGEYKNRLLRVGHMGSQADMQLARVTMAAIEDIIKK